jgi:hypothetical protein
MLKLIVMIFVVASNSAFAEVSLGGFFGTVSAEQSDLNKLMDNADSRAGGVSVNNLESAYEVSAYFQYRVDKSLWAFQLRPSYFFSSTDGSASGALGGKYAYSVSGFAVAGLVKVYPLESNYLRMYFIGGLNYGHLSTEIEEASFKVDASGSNLGFQFGVGLEVTLGSHGILFEAGVRKLAIERNLVDSTSGTAESGSVSQHARDSELELNNKDLGTSLSGVKVQLGYAFYF